jgi:hypothetical protein
MTARAFLAAAALIVAAAPGVAAAGPSYTLGRKAVCAETAVEVELTFEHSPATDRLVAGAGAAQQKVPDKLRARALAAARVTSAIYSAPSTPVPRPVDVYLPDRLWRLAYQRGRVRALIFVRRLAGKPFVTYGVEGAPSDLSPDYPDVRAALLQYARWREHPTDAAVRAEAETLRTTTTNPSVATLATSFLSPPDDCSHW